MKGSLINLIPRNILCRDEANEVYIYILIYNENIVMDSVCLKFLLYTTVYAVT